MRRLLDLWREYQAEPKEILDVGCGLGGGSLFWAENFQANVAAITVESTHVPIVAKFAERAGLGAQVSCRVADVLSLEEQGAYDAAVALGSTCHIARAAFYRRMAKVLRPGGCVVIADFYKGLGSKADERAGIVDEHWQCRLPHVREHLDGAAAAGFRLLSLHDLSKITQPFWEFSADLWRLEGKERVFKEGERARWERSVHCHEALYAGLGEGDLEYGFLVFRLGHDA